MLRLRIELRYGYGFRTARYRVYDVGVVLDCNVHPLRLFVAVDAEHFAAVARAPEALERRGVEVCRPVNANKRHCIRTICNLCLSRRCFDSFGALEYAVKAKFVGELLGAKICGYSRVWRRGALVNFQAGAPCL